MKALRWAFGLLLAACVCASSVAQTPGKPAAAGASLSVVSSNVSADAALHPGAAEWERATVRKIALNRTPPLFDTDEPASAEITSAEVRCMRADGRLYVRLSWKDSTRDDATLTAPPDSTPEKRFRKVPTEADDRFFDAAAVMVPDYPSAAINPSLQMGDAEHPVHIYYWNAARGSMLMIASGRATTRRTGKSIGTIAVYRNSEWVVTFELPSQPAGTPLAFAIWNGSQKDRDGRKYFSVWYTLE